MEMREVSYVPALYKIFDEILVNASDNFRRDPNQTLIDVVVDVEKGIISVKNDGKSVPVVMHQSEGVYVPELVFGNLLTGSNFDDSVAKATGGRNGYGAKLANIYSEWFAVEIWDKERELYYKQSWQKNMGEVLKPLIISFDGVEAPPKDYGRTYQGSSEKSAKTELRGEGTRITFKPDLSRFSTKEKSLAKGSDMVEIMKTRCFDIAACNPKLKVTFNGKVVPSSFVDYVKLFEMESLGSVFESFGDVNEGGTPTWQVGKLADF